MQNPNNSNIPALVATLKGLFQEAENQAKSAEYEYGEGPIIPAINELRYAGSHMIAYLAAEDDATRTQELDKAIRHCQRAIYDAVEARLMVLYSQFSEFQRTYTSVNLLVQLPNYMEILAISFDVRDAVGARKPDVSKDDHYARLQELHGRFAPLVRQTQIADVELRKELSKDLTESTRANRAIAIAAVAALFALGAWLFPRSPDATPQSLPVTAAALIPEPVRVQPLDQQLSREAPAQEESQKSQISGSFDQTVITSRKP